MEVSRMILAPVPQLRKELLTALLASVLAAFAIVAFVLLCRRIAGALLQPLAGISLVAVVLGGLMVVAVWRAVWLLKDRTEPVRLSDITKRMFWLIQLSGAARHAPQVLPLAVPGGALFLLLCVLSIPHTAAWSLMLAWLMFLTGETAWWWLAYSARNGSREMFALPVREAAAAYDERLPTSVFQQTTRSLQGEHELIAALVRLRFAAGQRVAVEHIAFCPPLQRIPALEAEVTSGLDAEITLTNIYTFGLRLEARLEELSDEACEVVVEIEGSTNLENPDPRLLSPT